MAFADPSTPFFSFAIHGVQSRCLLGTTRHADGTVPFAILDASGTRIDLDAPKEGHWSPASGFLAVDGEEVADVTDVTSTGPYLVIEKDGTGTIEADGSRHLDEGEILVTPSFLDSHPVGTRHVALAAYGDDDDGEADRISDALGAEDHVLGSPTCRL